MDPSSLYFNMEPRMNTDVNAVDHDLVQKALKDFNSTYDEYERTGNKPTTQSILFYIMKKYNLVNLEKERELFAINALICLVGKGE